MFNHTRGVPKWLTSILQNNRHMYPLELRRTESIIARKTLTKTDYKTLEKLEIISKWYRALQWLGPRAHAPK